MKYTKCYSCESRMYVHDFYEDVSHLHYCDDCWAMLKGSFINKEWECNEICGCEGKQLDLSPREIGYIEGVLMLNESPVAITIKDKLKEHFEFKFKEKENDEN